MHIGVGFLSNRMQLCTSIYEAVAYVPIQLLGNKLPLSKTDVLTEQPQ